MTADNHPTNAAFRRPSCQSRRQCDGYDQLKPVLIDSDLSQLRLHDTHDLYTFVKTVCVNEYPKSDSEAERSDSDVSGVANLRNALDWIRMHQSGFYLQSSAMSKGGKFPTISSVCNETLMTRSSNSKGYDSLSAVSVA